MSTKCQYHTPAPQATFHPLWKWPAQRRNQLKTRNNIPPRTWAPWKPVNKKKVLPKAPSAIEKGASLYSVYWANSNNTPSTMVTPNQARAPSRFEARIRPFARFSVAEDHTRVTRLKRGTPRGLIGLVPTGGHLAPARPAGDQDT